jgi:hypothetical protein
MPSGLARQVAAAPRTSIDGRFERHQSAKLRQLIGSDSGGRWSPPRRFPVMYLGRPRDSVVIEAYRHLVDPFIEDGMTGEMAAPRRILTVAVKVAEVLDLRSDEAQTQVGLRRTDLMSPIGEYPSCQRVGHIAHQLGLHGVLAPAATGLGETLALFERHLPSTEIPTIIEEEVLDGLPADPRRLRLFDPMTDAG